MRGMRGELFRVEWVLNHYQQSIVIPDSKHHAVHSQNRSDSETFLLHLGVLM